MPTAAATAQPELDFTTPAPAVSAEEVATFCRLLRGKRWQKAQWVVVEASMVAGLDWNERRVRAIAEASGGAVVSYPGSPGYCLLDEASLAEIDHAVAALQSQGQRMIARSLALDKRARQRRLVDRPQQP